jgi:hypothetical protein
MYVLAVCKNYLYTWKRLAGRSEAITRIFPSIALPLIYCIRPSFPATDESLTLAHTNINSRYASSDYDCPIADFETAVNHIYRPCPSARPYNPSAFLHL